MQSCNTKHHQDTQYKEIPNKRGMPQTNSATGHITPWPHKLNACRTAIIKQTINAKSPKQATRLVFRNNAMESTTECLKTLHWLLIQQWIDYKICTLIYKCHSKQAPVYLQNLIEEKTTTCPSLRSENKKALLAVSNVRNQTFASRSFSVYGPKLWNSLPNTIRKEVRFEKFKSKLKTDLFTIAYM